MSKTDELSQNEAKVSVDLGRHLTFSDLIGLVICWGGIIGVDYLALSFLSNGLYKAIFLALSLFPAYWLSKWIITGESW